LPTAPACFKAAGGDGACYRGLEPLDGIDVAVENLRRGERISMPRFATISATALGLTCAICSTSGFAISVPAANRTVSATPPAVKNAALVCRERCGYYYGCRQICVHRPGFYGMYGPDSYGWYRYAREPWRGRWWHQHEDEHEHWGHYGREGHQGDEDTQ